MSFNSAVYKTNLVLNANDLNPNKAKLLDES